MIPFKKPLVVMTEQCDPLPAFERALGLAQAAGTDVTLLHVADAMTLEEPDAEGVLAKLAAALMERRNAAVAALRSQASRVGVSVTATLLTGSAFRLAIQAVLRDGHDVVLKTIDRRAPGARATQGSTDKHLLRKCPVPVWLIDPDAPPAGAAVVAAVNADPSDKEDRALGLEILRAATAIAAFDRVKLDVVYAWRVLGEWLLRGPQPLVSDKEVDHIVGKTLNQRIRFLDELIDEAGLSDASATPHVVHARPADAIIDFVRTHPTRLLVMGTIGRTGIPGLLIGNTAEQVLSEVTCSVLTLKPAGFVSPVTLEA